MTIYRTGIMVLAVSLQACPGPTSSVDDAGFDAGPGIGLDSGTDAGVDAGTDGGPDAGSDAGSDAGADSGVRSVSINNNAPTTDSPKVTLTLTASDSMGITGYFASESSTRPSATQMGWTAVPSTTAYTAHPTFMLSSGDGMKTVRVWYKDAAQNISSVSEDSIEVQRNDSWKNAFLIAWRGDLNENITFARQAGYEYIAIRIYTRPADYIMNPKFANIRFVVTDPQYQAFDQLNVPQVIDTNRTHTHTQTEIDFFNRNLAWKSDAGFPNNIATGWHYDNGTKFNAMWDYQQQRVIDMVVDAELKIFEKYEDKAISFLFAGYALDLTRMTGDFNRWDSATGRNVATKLEYWTGTRDSSLLHPGITHEYQTYSEGWVAHFKKLNVEMKKKFPNAKWIIEPWVLYESNTNRDDEWIRQIKDRPDKLELIPDKLEQESSGEEFVDEPNNFRNLPITKDMVGTSQQELLGEAANRFHAAKAAVNGAWYSWFGHFGINPNWQTIKDVYPRLKLIRLVPGWDNLRNIPLSQRVYDGGMADPIYSSKANSAQPNPTSYFDRDIIYSRHWKSNNNKIFVVFNTVNGTLKLNPGETPASIYCDNDLFEEFRRCDSYFDIGADGSGNKTLKLKSNVVGCSSHLG